MTARPPTRLDRYLAHRRRYEIGVWATYWMLQASFGSAVAIMDFTRVEIGIEVVEPIIWEFSSCLVLLALLPLILAFDRRYPLRADTWRRNLPAHLLATLPFSLIHVLGMVGLRKLAYLAAGGRYDFGDWPTELFYEYLKDFRTYLGTLAMIYLYRLILLRLQGEASLLAEPDEGPPVEPVERPERFLVRKLGKEFLVAAADIEWLEASGNYVNLQMRGHHYPLRSTIAAIESRLDPRRFVRVHRSYIVNLDHLVEIEPLDTGDARLRLRDGHQIPCSRRYRAALRGLGNGNAAA